LQFVLFEKISNRQEQKQAFLDLCFFPTNHSRAELQPYHVVTQPYHRVS